MGFTKRLITAINLVLFHSSLGNQLVNLISLRFTTVSLRAGYSVEEAKNTIDLMLMGKSVGVGRFRWDGTECERERVLLFKVNV